jgi:hypothetical protein
MWSNYSQQSPLVRASRLQASSAGACLASKPPPPGRSTGIVFRSVVLKAELGLLIPKKKDATLPQGRLFLRRPGIKWAASPPPPLKEDMGNVAEYLRQQAALRTPERP